MKRLLLVIFVVSLLAGCNRGARPSEDPETETNTEPYVEQSFSYNAPKQSVQSANTITLGDATYTVLESLNGFSVVEDRGGVRTQINHDTDQPDIRSLSAPRIQKLTDHSFSVTMRAVTWDGEREIVFTIDTNPLRVL